MELHGGDPDVAQSKFAERLAKQLDQNPTISVLRHGVEDLGVTIRLAYFRPASALNPELVEFKSTTRAIDDDREVERYIAQRSGRGVGDAE